MAELNELIVPATEDEVNQRLLDVAELNELPVTSWQTGSFALTAFATVAEVFSDAWFSVAQIANGVILDLSTGAWLDYWASSTYGDARLQAVFTVGDATLTDAGGGPHTIAIGDLTVSNEAGLKFRNTTGGTLAASGTLDLTFAAVASGSAYNVANGAITVLVTTLPTVTITNPAIGATGTWITTLGTDQETDAALRVRLRAKWATLATGSPPGAYLYWALSTVGVTRAKVNDQNPDGPGTNRDYIDSAGAVSTLQATLDANVPTGTRSTAVVTTTETVGVPGVVTVAAAYAATAPALIDANLVALANATDIGGIVRLADIYEAIMTVTGVVDFAIGSSWAGVGTPANVQLAASAIPSLTNSLTYVTG